MSPADTADTEWWSSIDNWDPDDIQRWSLQFLQDIDTSVEASSATSSTIRADCQPSVTTASSDFHSLYEVDKVEQAIQDHVVGATVLAEHTSIAEANGFLDPSLLLVPPDTYALDTVNSSWDPNGQSSLEFHAQSCSSLPRTLDFSSVVETSSASRASEPDAVPIGFSPTLLDLPDTIYQPGDQVPESAQHPLTTDKSALPPKPLQNSVSGGTILPPWKPGKQTKSLAKREKGPAPRQKNKGLATRVNTLTTDSAPKTVLERDQKTGKVQGVFSTFGLTTRVRAPLSDEARAATALTRKRGVCERCRKFKARCELPDDPYGPCKRCAILSPGAVREICTRVSILDLPLHRLGSTKDNALDKWMTAKLTMSMENLSLDPDRRQIKLTQDFDFEFEVTVEKYPVQPGDVTSYPWRDSSGTARVLDMPPYFIVDMEAKEKDIEAYNKRSYLVYIQRLLRGQNPLILKTFQEAIRYGSTASDTLVKDALRFWAACRITGLPWRICGTDTLGLSPVADLDYPRSGTVPVTPVMDTQLDHLVIKAIINPLRKNILARLYTKIMNKRKEDWYEIYLTIFVLMSNMERLFSQIVLFFDVYGVDNRFTTGGHSSISHSYIHSSKALLAYFHFACGGHVPLATNWHNPQAPRHLVTDDQVKYMEEARKEIDKQGTQLSELKTKPIYGTEMYWCHQLIIPGCEVNEQNDKNIDDMQEDDFILHWSE